MLCDNIGRANPDLLVTHGDQVYEGSPTGKSGGRAPELDWLYKYLLWVWSFQALTRKTPTIVLLDDHDMYQGNIWGEGGVRAPGGQPAAGGYVNTPRWVNVVHRASCGHNPDPFDPTPVARGIVVYYSSFSYGGVSLAVVEDRKFKTGADGLDANGNPLPEDQLVLIGRRQARFLSAWQTQHPGRPKVLLTQTLWACVQTSPAGRPQADRDSNGWPPLARHRALRLVRGAHALMLSGDQHLGSLVRHGVDGVADGPVQFTPPAASSSWQRWFEPAGPLPEPGSTPYTGNWIDGFGNRVRVLAVVNPSFTQAEYRAHHPGRGQEFGDRALKNEGFGIVRINHAARVMDLECWRWDTDPAAPGAQQYPGFPFRLPFDQM
jgi:alkaline phosphatase D